VTDEQVKVLDFGLALVRARASMHSENTPIGTLAYLAPELLREQDQSCSDLYAVGVMAYEMLTVVIPLIHRISHA